MRAASSITPSPQRGGHFCVFNQRKAVDEGEAYKRLSRTFYFSLSGFSLEVFRSYGRRHNYF